MARRLLITWASSGIGRAAALLAVRQGYHVAVHFHSQEGKARELAGEDVARLFALNVGGVLLSSREAIKSFITGTTVDVSGGGFHIAR
jgi:NADPH:quinone reductase-like Zn-dependent oxidoreductase